MIKKIETKLEVKLSEMFSSDVFKNTMKGIVNEADYKFKVVVTTEGVDRDGETIKAEGLEVENYLKNPVVLANHEYKIESIIGKTIKIYQNDAGETIAEGVFAKGVEKAELVRTLYNQGFIKTVSVGFIPKQRAENDNSVITKWEMLEYSFVAVPANPEALSLDGKVYKKCIKEGLIKEIQTESVTAENLNEGDMVTYRHIDIDTNDNGVEVIEYYPNMSDLPRMGKIIKKLTNGEEVITWDNEAITASNENPILIIHDYIKSENGPIIRVQSITLKEFKELLIEKIISQKEFESGSVKFSNKNEIDLKEVLDNIKELKNDFSEMKTNLKTFSDEKEEKTNLEKTRKLGQDLAKSVSAFLQEAKSKK